MLKWLSLQKGQPLKSQPYKPPNKSEILYIKKPKLRGSVGYVEVPPTAEGPASKITASLAS